MPDSHPLVTIGIPTYNRAQGNLKHALQCALNQTYQNIEIIVSDNCSTDDTEEFMKQYSDSRLRYIRQTENIGANSNFNFCVNEAKGKYFLLLHDDDMIEPDIIESCISTLKNGEDVGIIYTGVRIIDSNGNTTKSNPVIKNCKTFIDFVHGWMENKFSLYMCSTLFNTKKLQDLGGFNSPTHLYQDVVAEMILVATLGAKSVPEIKAAFRRHEDNRGGLANVAEWCEDGLYLVESICKLAPNDHLLRTKISYYICKQLYKKARTIPNPLKRYFTYLTLAMSFKFAYSPIEFAWRQDIRPRLRKMKAN